MNTNTIYTIGSGEKRTREDFLCKLKDSNVTLLLDIRSKRGSRNLPFDETRFQNLSRMLSEGGVSYDAELHEILGGLQNGKMTLGNFREYTKTEAFKNGLNKLIEKVQMNVGNTVILCCETNPKHCHRKIVADYLVEHNGWNVVHLE